MAVFLAMLNDIRSPRYGHLRASFFTSSHRACSVIQLTKWMRSPDEESDLSLFLLYSIFRSFRHYKAVTHLQSFTDDTLVFFLGSPLNGSLLGSAAHTPSQLANAAQGLQESHALLVSVLAGQL